MTAAANAALGVFGARRELALVTLLFTIIFLMIVPLPTALVDVLIATNMALAIILVVIGVSLRDPLDFSTLPAVILISVIFRLALSITTTRLILATGDAGQIIETFGDFVVFGNLVVGLVIFLIITVVQFLVITKGAERVAEVAARFALDGLPGKQMAIDSDLRSGLITVEEARDRRTHIEKQMQFYGAMDGAMKFVKGDAIAGLAIIAINLLGGLAIGALQRGMPVSDALSLYALLTIGDGLVSQIPALMLSITAGVIITRVASEKRQSLGADLGLQLFARPLTLRIAAAALLVFALTPGLPWLTFLSLSVGLLIAAEIVRRADVRRQAEETTDGASSEAALAEAARLAPMPLATLDLAPDLAASFAPQRPRSRHSAPEDTAPPPLVQALDAMRRRFFETTGVWHPPITLRPDPGLATGRIAVRLDGVTRADGAARADGALLAAAEAAPARLAGMSTEPDALTLGDARFLGLPPEEAARAEAAGLSPLTPETALAEAVEAVSARHAALFVGVEETRLLLSGAERHYAELVRQALALCPIERLARMLQALVEDGVSIRPLRTILNAVVEWAPQESDPELLAEYVRTSLKAQISAQHASSLGVVPAWLIESERLERLRGAIHDSAHGSYIALDQATTRRLLAALEPLTAPTDAAGPAEGARAVLLAPIDLRRLLQKLLRQNETRIPVLSYQDIAPEAKLHCMGTLSF